MEFHEVAKKLLNEAQNEEEKQHFEHFISMILCYRKHMRLKEVYAVK